ncbi:hypothetical protein UI24_16290 [Mycobacteroides franklinii]|nr:hypothetical protein [Mycobacteroides franklinii]
MLTAALTVLAVLGCGVELPHAVSATAISGESGFVAAVGTKPELITPHADDARADVDAPCPHGQLAQEVFCNDNPSLKWATAIPLINPAATGIAISAGIRGPPRRPRAAAVHGGCALLHQLCVNRR